MNLNLASTVNPKLIIRIVLGLGVLVFYDVLLDWLLALPHAVFMILHYIFETCEQLLDWIIEHLFHTSPRTTEIIVFYIMASGIASIALMVLRALPGWYCKSCARLTRYWQQKIDKALTLWQQQAVLIKVKWYSLLMVSSFFMLFLAFS